MAIELYRRPNGQAKEAFAVKTGAPLRSVLVVAGSLVMSLVAALASWYAASWVAGPNVSDIGVPMYAAGGMAFLSGLFLYGVIVFISLTLAGTAAKIVRKQIWSLGSIIALLIFLPLTWFLHFSFG
jgi:hypothetical protein